MAPRKGRASPRRRSSPMAAPSRQAAGAASSSGATRTVTAPWQRRTFSYAVALAANQNCLVTKASMFGYLVSVANLTAVTTANSVCLWTAARLVAVKMTPLNAASSTVLTAWNFQWLGNQSTVAKFAYACPSSVVRSFTERPPRDIRAALPISVNASAGDLFEEMFEISLDENNSGGGPVVSTTATLRVDITIDVQGINESGARIVLSLGAATTAPAGLYSLPLDSQTVAPAHAGPLGLATPIGIPAYLDSTGHTNYGQLLTVIPK